MAAEPVDQGAWRRAVSSVSKAGRGAGKSTQLRRLADRLRTAGVRDVVLTREPGGSPGAETLRDLLVRGAVDRWSPLSETLILYAAREDHLERTIRPALTRGAWVLCDRFADSTRAYQGVGGGEDTGFIARLESEVIGPTWPELTLILDLPVEVGLARAASRGGAETRFEAKGGAFHARLRQGFLDIARREPDRCVVLDGAAAIDAVTDAAWSAVRARFSELQSTDSPD